MQHSTMAIDRKLLIKALDMIEEIKSNDDLIRDLLELKKRIPVTEMADRSGVDRITISRALNYETFKNTSADTILKLVKLVEETN